MKPWVLAMGLAAAGVGTAAIVLGRRDPERKKGGQMPAPEPSTPISGSSDLMYAGGSPDFDMTGGDPVILRDGESAYQQWKRENAGNDWQLSTQSKSSDSVVRTWMSGLPNGHILSKPLSM
jgi:hypothetical protein